MSSSTAHLVATHHGQCWHLSSQGLPHPDGICSCNTVPKGYPVLPLSPTTQGLLTLLCLSHADRSSPYSPPAPEEVFIVSHSEENKVLASLLTPSPTNPNIILIFLELSIIFILKNFFKFFYVFFLSFFLFFFFCFFCFFFCFTNFTGSPCWWNERWSLYHYQNF